MERISGILGPLTLARFLAVFPMHACEDVAAMKVKHRLGCIGKSTASMWREVFIHLYLGLRKSQLHFEVPSIGKIQTYWRVQMRWLGTKAQDT